ncbi:Ig-like domain-containing protein [Actinoplanes sp. NPDC026623]|uniref:Ig-like domain-containing protein n=1 Tax=Actinoplanes sp. NPDC026623 TaxID=3155610 RepID=UPI0033CEF152
MHTPSRHRRTRTALTAAIAGSLLLGASSPAVAVTSTPDLAPPVISNTGITDGQLARTVFSFYPTVTDDVGVVRLEALLNGDPTAGTCAITTVTRPFCRVFLSGLANDIDATVTVRAYDAAENHAEATTQIHVDNVAPALVFTPPPESSMRSGSVTITLHDVPADVKAVQVVSVPGDLLARLTGAPWEYTWQAAEGVSSPCFTIWDLAGNSRQLCTHYTVDDTGPTATITPGNRALVRGTRFTTTVKASDPSGIARSYLAGADGAGTTGSYTNATLKAGKDGTRTITWVLLDTLGNQTTATRTVIIDNTTPTLTITKAPKNKAKLTKKATLTATASDRNGIARVQLLVNGKVAGTDTKAGYSFTLNPKTYGKKFTVQMRAYDKAGNVKYSTKRTYHR